MEKVDPKLADRFVFYNLRQEGGSLKQREVRNMMTALIRLCLLIVCFLVSGPGQAQDTPSQTPPPYIFLKHCPQQEADRFRLCPKFYQDAFVKRPDEVIYLRSRLSDMMRGMEANAQRNFRLYYWSSRVILVGISAAVLLYWFAPQLRALIRFFAPALLAIALGAIASLGWLNLYKAEFRSYVVVSALRTEVETALVAAARTNQDIKPEQIAKWGATLQQIAQEHGKGIAESFSLPTSSLLPALVP